MACLRFIGIPSLGSRRALGDRERAIRMPRQKGESRPWGREGRYSRAKDSMKKAEEARLRKRRERMARDGQDDGDVTYINEKNKQFNQKLSRFYNKYTAEIRDSFERGTMI